MKFSLLAAAIVALALTACGKPQQANPESIEGYGVRTEEGTTMDEERAVEGANSGVADPNKFNLDHAAQAEELADKAEAAVGSTADATKDSLEAAKSNLDAAAKESSESAKESVNDAVESSTDAAKDGANKTLDAMKL